MSWRRRRAARVGGLADDLANPDPTTAVDERDALIRQIAQLPPQQRAVIALGYYESQSDAEIAAALGCSAVTVRSHRSRALAALRTTLDKSSTATHREV